MNKSGWVQMARDPQSSIETLRAHFTGHAYDPHWHDSYLVGVTEQGVQQFHSRRQQHHSHPGTVFLLEPGELHDGDAIDDSGFTYRMLYIEPLSMRQQLSSLFSDIPDSFELNFANTLSGDRQLAWATFHAFQTLHDGELTIVKESALQRLFCALTRHLHWRRPVQVAAHERTLALRARDFMMDNRYDNIGLSDIAATLGIDRFRLSREFHAHFGLPPHAWLIQLRLSEARRLLSAGQPPARVAAQLGFADQSHLGRWFKRAYQLTPAFYHQHCTNLPD